MNLTRGGVRSIPSLDGLRAISISFVILSHANRLPDFPKTLTFSTHYALLGVRIFFVISGYLITTLLLKELDKSSSINLPRFYLRRSLRIFPAYYVFVACVALAGVAKLLPLSGAHWAPVLTYTSNLFVTNSWFTGHSWSLSMEEQFYLFWPLLLRLGGRQIGLWFAIIVLVSSPIIRVVSYFVTHQGYISAVAGFDAIAAGCILAVTFPRLSKSVLWVHASQSWWFGLVPVIAIITHFIGSSGLRWYWAFDIAIGQTIVAVMVALSVAWAITNPSGVIGTLLNLRILRWLGLLSYSLYLWQEVFLWERSAFPIWAAVSAALIMAICSFFLVEKPSFWLRGKIERMLTRGKLPSGPDPSTRVSPTTG